MNKYNVQDIRSYLGDAAVWWRPGRVGYTTRLTEAGLYDEAEAREIERLSGTDRAWPEDVVRAAAIQVVYIQDLLT